MNSKIKNILISSLITSLLAAFIFIINDSNAPLGASFGAYVKLEFTRYFGFITGIIAIVVALIFRFSKKSAYTNTLTYTFVGILNLLIGIYAVLYFFLYGGQINVMHNYLINLLIGVIILSDIFYL